jgi:outer membrane protein TolC
MNSAGRLLLLALLSAAPAAAQGQPPPPQTVAPAPAALSRVTFDEAIRLALTRNPTIEEAAAAVLRADGLLRQATAVVLPNADLAATNITLDDARGLAGRQFTPRNTFSASLAVSMPLLAPAEWARRTHAQDNRGVALAGSDDARRQVALAAADAYLAVLARRRVVEAQVRARDTAKAFFDYAHDRFVAGAGSKLNELRAQQTLSSDLALVEQADLSLYRAQEALGVVIAADGPVDVVDEPPFLIPDQASVMSDVDGAIQTRADIILFDTQLQADERVVADSWKDYLPSVVGIFQPQYQHPASVVSPETSWRALLQFSMPVFDAGFRRGLKMQRQATLQQSQAVLSGQLRQARSEVRASYESVERSQRVLDATKAAAAQAEDVLRITDISFRAGATTNIELIDAQRRARDADTAVAVAEDGVRRARLDLLAALGRFP